MKTKRIIDERFAVSTVIFIAYGRILTGDKNFILVSTLRYTMVFRLYSDIFNESTSLKVLFCIIVYVWNELFRFVTSK